MDKTRDILKITGIATLIILLFLSSVVSAFQIKNEFCSPPGKTSWAIGYWIRNDSIGTSWTNVIGLGGDIETYDKYGYVAQKHNVCVNSHIT